MKITLELPDDVIGVIVAHQNGRGVMGMSNLDTATIKSNKVIDLRTAGAVIVKEHDYESEIQELRKMQIKSDLRVSGGIFGIINRISYDE